MSKPRISDEAVEAAAKQLAFTDRPDVEWGQHAGSYRNRYRNISRKALEAAAPHLMAQAWDACANSLVYEDGSKVEVAANTNPYRNSGAGE